MQDMQRAVKDRVFYEKMNQTESSSSNAQPGSHRTPKPMLNLSKVVTNQLAAPPSARTLTETIKSQILSRTDNVGYPDEMAFERHLAEALIYSKAMWWNQCLERMISAMAFIERCKLAAETEEVLETHATISHNIGSVLHQLGHFEAATLFYDEGHRELFAMGKAPAPGPCSCLLSAFDVRPRQLQFMLERARLASRGEKPDPTVYLSPWGNEVRLTPSEIAEAIVQAKDLEGEDKKPAWMESMPRNYKVGSTPRAQLW